MKANRKSINLFDDKSIRPYKVVFNITDEEDLLVWWEYHLEHSIIKYSDSINFLHTLYRSCFHLLMDAEVHFDIIFEKSSDNVYWTICANVSISDLVVHTEFIDISEFKIHEDKISFKVSTEQPKSKPKTKIPDIKITQAPRLNIVFDFLDHEDKEHLKEINDELSEELAYLEGKGFSDKSITKIQMLLFQYTLTLSAYVEVIHIKNSLDELSYYMTEHKATLVLLDKAYVSLFEGLIINLQKWFDALFVNGTDSSEAYKSSINADVQIIKTMTLQNEEHGDIEFF